MLLIESGLVAVAVLVAVVYPGAASHFFGKIEQGVIKLARRRGLSVLVVGVTSLSLRLALLPILSVPTPLVHDEFGYLLAADTFAHGRITNPTHPMWTHFETFSILQKPTYQSYAQPAQGLLLAAGQVIAAHPFWGVWLSAGMMCAAICWMLQAWLPAEWALLGAFLAVVRFGVFSYWANSYWGGALAATAGALVVGALPRIKEHQRLCDVLLLATGLGILANSRPYEGLVFSLPVAVALFAWPFGKDHLPFHIWFRRVVMPLCVVLAVTAAGMGYYFWRVTGNPFRLPYQVERETYGVAPYLLWQSSKPQPIYHHKDIQNVYANAEVTLYQVSRTPVGFVYVSAAKAWDAWRFFLGPALTLPVLMASLMGFSWRRIIERTRFLLLASAVSIAGLLLELFFFPHYAAPLTCLILALVLIAMRRLRLWQWHGNPSGLFLTRAIPAICVTMFLLRVSAATLHIPLTRSRAAAWYQAERLTPGRSEILSELQRLPGEQLVIVRYNPHRIPDEEWVYNQADIDSAKIVWARDMSPAENEELIGYYAGRHVWLLEADARPPRLLPYGEADLTDTHPVAQSRKLSR